jgi:hypothetical protein
VSDYEARKAAALDALAEGDAERAFRELRWALTDGHAGDVDAARLADGLGVLARIIVAMGDRELAERCAAASVAIGDDTALYELGYQLIEAGLPGIAATVLRRCLALVPGTEAVVTELVAALERDLRYGDARAVLEAHPELRAESFLCRYLYAYDAAMSGDLAVTRAVGPTLVPRDDGERFMAERIAAIVGRADRVSGVCPLDATDLRGWHYVITGGVLLHRSAHGYADGMRGRYAWLQDSLARVRTGLERLRDALAAWGISPPCVYAPPGRDHEVLAAAASLVLGVPGTPWPAVGLPAPGLVVVYDLATVPWRDLERLVDRRPGQILYAHASPWTEDAGVAPDLTTLLHQSLVAPWSERLVLADAAGPRTRPADDRPPELIASEVPGTSGLDAAETEHDDLPGLAALIAAAGAPVVGRRERLWAGSPVASNRFL